MLALSECVLFEIREGNKSTYDANQLQTIHIDIQNIERIHINLNQIIINL